MLSAVILVPLVAAGFAYVIPSNRWRTFVVPLTSLAHATLVLRVLRDVPPAELGGWLVLDPLGKVVLALVATLFLGLAVYAPAYLALRFERPNRVFCACLLASLSMMTLVAVSHHLGLMWVAVEATTLACAPLLYFNHNRRSLEATWKYLLIGSVGIALALWGSFFLAYSSLRGGFESTLLFDDLVEHAADLSKPWLHTAFVVLIVGYGTKMGLAPMHTWKPDAYGEAPGMVGAWFAGGVTSCSFLAILRFFQIARAAGEIDFAQPILIAMGLISMAFAAVFVVRQRDFKRMLAFSSVEHMGILVLGIGVGGMATFGALLHLLNNAFSKGVLFLSAANIHRAYQSKYADEVSGAIRRLPWSGSLFLCGFLAITGTPPAGPFLSEFTIASGAFVGGRSVIGGLYLLMLAIIFIGMGATVLRVVSGSPSAAASNTALRDTIQTAAPIVVFALLVVLLGIYIPAPIDRMLREAVALLEAKQ